VLEHSGILPVVVTCGFTKSEVAQQRAQLKSIRAAHG
jgi:hypothetical protein